jgi:murein DD-endopeptidase MepM/ murein hydrolase activator NlpD
MLQTVPRNRWRQSWQKGLTVLALAVLSWLLLVTPGTAILPRSGLSLLDEPSTPGSTPYLAQATSTASVEELRQQQQQIEQERSRLEREQERLENLQGVAEERLEGLQDNIQVTQAEIAHNEEQLAIANQRLAELQAELATAEKSYQERQSATIARLQFLQRQQLSTGWAVLLQSDSLNEFIDRRRQLKLVYQSDSEILTRLKAEADELDRKRRNVEIQKNEIALLTQQLQAQKAQYEAQAQTQEQLISRLNADRQALEAAEAQLARDSENLTRLIQQRLAAQDGSIVVRGTGQFSYPSSGRITSPFGHRVHPILGYRRFHAGVDFGASHGSPIRAADSGVVIFAGWYGGYGRSVIVNHGGGLTTLYAHASRLYVSEGQTVQRGEAIAAIGSTGLSTGPHLHFEVRVNGNPVDPMGYL